MNLQDVANLTIPEGEVKMIHDKNNRLLWGRLSYDTTYRGDTFQQTYRGKNLMPYNSYDADDGRIMNMPDLVLPIGTFTISFDLESFTLGTSNSIGILLYLVDENGDSSYDDGSGNKTIFTIDSSTQIGRYSYIFTTKAITHKNNTNFRIGATQYDNGARCKITNIQIESGSTPTTYEPYVGGIPAPSPDYPQDVNVVTGEQTIGIHGKNLFDTYSTTVYAPSGTYGDVSNNNGVITTNVNGRARIGNGFIVPVPVEPGETYCISAKLVETTSTYNIKGTFDIRAVVSGGKGTRVKLFNFYSLGTSSTKFIIPDGVTEIWVAFMTYEAGNYSIFSDVQIEKGSSATSFEPGTPHSYTVNLGSTELCKIGDYQDYIYKNGNDWYVHKEINKVIPTLISGLYSSAGIGYIGARIDKFDMMQNSRTEGYCNLLTPMNSPSGATEEGITFGTTSNNRIYIILKDTRMASSTEANWNTWLTTNQPIIYYPLTTPTDTKITDATLVGQLNAVHQFLTRYGYDFDISGNLPIIINQGGLT